MKRERRCRRIIVGIGETTPLSKLCMGVVGRAIARQSSKRARLCDGYRAHTFDVRKSRRKAEICLCVDQAADAMLSILSHGVTGLRRSRCSISKRKSM